MTRTFLLLALLAACLAASTFAQTSPASSSTGLSSANTTSAAAAAPAEAPTPAQKIHYEWAHGALMSIAFGFFLPAGIIFARFFRSPKYSPAWLRLHQVFMLVGFALIIAGFAIAVDKFDNDNYSKRVNSYHRKAGFYVFAAVCLQVFLGFVRPATPPPASGEKPTAQRVAWNEVHRWNGRVAYVFGLAQVYTGVQILDGGSTTLWYALFSALWGALILVALLLQVVVCARGAALGDDGTYTRTTLTGNTTEKLTADQPQNGAVPMHAVKVDGGAGPGVVTAVTVVTQQAPAVQGASITRPDDGGAPYVYAAPAAANVVQVA